MKKVMAISLAIGFGIFVSWLFMPDRPDTYVVFAYATNLNPDLTTALTNRLEQNRISYQLDTSGNVFVLESHLEKAVICCS
ncbi:hypothetical protein [Paenibacillus elgii]|uniref:hypothetical protein n=1 Tax=Paenibacillus elgii TaxID=189691 RepID=UPI000FD99178|nr:hypothetical protein [Paenibacillus elgii]MCM3268690.1 hypothetical protein [Paenibacillus elgii]NEN83928.1 hypothetical protein [Paenibacillus elgii]